MGIGVAEVDSNPNSGVEDSAEGYFAMLQMILPSLLLVQLVNPFRRGQISLGLKSPRHYLNCMTESLLFPGLRL
ncbi:unnamed protein product [Arabidopsis halleri]